MTAILAVMAFIGIIVTVFVLTAVISGIIEGCNKRIKKAKADKIILDNSTTGHRLMQGAYLFKDPHAFNAIYLLGKMLAGNNSAILNEIAAEVEELNNLKCK